MAELNDVIRKAKPNAEVAEYMKNLRRAIRSAGLLYTRDNMTFAFPDENRRVVFSSTDPVIYEILDGLAGFENTTRVSGGTAQQRAEERAARGEAPPRAKGEPRAK